MAAKLAKFVNRLRINKLVLRQIYKFEGKKDKMDKAIK